MINDPPGVFVVWLRDLARTPLVDTQGRPVPGRVVDVREGNRVAIVKTEPAPCSP